MARTLRDAALRVWNYVVWERNPIVQTLYVVLMLWCKYAFVTEAYPYIPNKYVDEYHKWTTLTLFVAAFGLFIYMCRSDPGVITHENIHQFKKYPHHPVLFPENKYCRTCKLPKLPRSKHCRVCNHCVARFDHHFIGGANPHLSSAFDLVWFSTCVGVHNYGAFILFLVAQLAISVEGFYVTSSVFIVQSMAIAQDGSDEQFRNALHYVISNNQPLGFVAAASSMVAVVVWFFLMVQLKRITLNVTASESFKRDALHAQADPDNVTGAKRLFNLLISSLPSSGEETMSKDEMKKELDSSWGGMFSPDTILNTEEEFTKDDVDFNPYKLTGLLANFEDAFQGRARAAAVVLAKAKQS